VAGAIFPRTGPRPRALPRGRGFSRSIQGLAPVPTRSADASSASLPAAPGRLSTNLAALALDCRRKIERAAEALHDRAADRKPEPGPMPHRLRGEEGIEDSAPIFFRDAGPGYRIVWACRWTFCGCNLVKAKWRLLFTRRRECLSGAGKRAWLVMGSVGV